MPIRLILNGAMLKPVIVCDHCGKTIAMADDGNYQWSFDAAETPAGSNIFFTHKGCCSAFDKANPGMGAEELEVLPVRLIDCLQIEYEQAKASLRLNDSIIP